MADDLLVCHTMRRTWNSTTFYNGSDSVPQVRPSFGPKHQRYWRSATTAWAPQINRSIYSLTCAHFYKCRTTGGWLLMQSFSHNHTHFRRPWLACFKRQRQVRIYPGREPSSWQRFYNLRIKSFRCPWQQKFRSVFIVWAAEDAESNLYFRVACPTRLQAGLRLRTRRTQNYWYISTVIHWQFQSKPNSVRNYCVSSG
jgi:hypothetical protein